MRRLSLTILVVLALASTLLGQGLPHMIYGWVKNYNGSIPDSICLTFEAYVEGRSFDKLTERSYPNAGYSVASGGVWGINTAGFTPQPASGQRIFLTFRDTCRNEIGYDTVVVDNSSSYQMSDTTLLFPIVYVKDKELPKGYSVDIFPNPFNSVVHIVVEYDKNVPVSAKIYDILGREINELYCSYGGMRNKVELMWDGLSKDKRVVLSGIYFVEIQVGERTTTRKLLFLK